MTFVLIGVAAFIAWRIFQKNTVPTVPAEQLASVAPGDVRDIPDSFDRNIEIRARLKEVDLLAEAQAKFNLQRRYDLIAKAHGAANPESVPKA